MGTKTKKKTKISTNFHKRNGGINAQWLFEWFEPREEPENERD